MVGLCSHCHHVCWSNPMLQTPYVVIVRVSILCSNWGGWDNRTSRLEWLLGCWLPAPPASLCERHQKSAIKVPDMMPVSQASPLELGPDVEPMHPAELRRLHQHDQTSEQCSSEFVKKFCFIAMHGLYTSIAAPHASYSAMRNLLFFFFVPSYVGEGTTLMPRSKIAGRRLKGAGCGSCSECIIFMELSNVDS